MERLGLLRTIEDEDILDISEAMKTALEPDTMMGKVVKGLGSAGKAFFSNPLVATAAMHIALDQYEKYRQNQRYATRLFGKTFEEKKMYRRMVDDLVGTGKWKLVKNQYVDGGQLWVLRRINESKTDYQELLDRKAPLSPTEKQAFRAAEIDAWRSIYDGKTVYVTERNNLFLVAPTVVETIENAKKLQTL